MPAFGEDEAPWVERANEAAARGPLGHHTHWTAPDHARPTSDRDRGSRPGEGRGCGSSGLAPTLFCGGGWYTDVEVAEACAELGYVDCTPRASRRPSYLAPASGGRRSRCPPSSSCRRVETLRAIPTTHSLGDLARALASRELPRLVHVYFHDTDLLDRRRRGLLGVVLLRALARRADVVDLDALAARVAARRARVAWDDVARL